MGAWIETQKNYHHLQEYYVAPRVGAWIETTCRSVIDTGTSKSPLAWGRGLKLILVMLLILLTMSPLAWGRGLKHLLVFGLLLLLSRPSRGGVD